MPVVIRGTVPRPVARDLWSEGRAVLLPGGSGPRAPLRPNAGARPGFFRGPVGFVSGALVPGEFADVQAGGAGVVNASGTASMRPERPALRRR